MLSTDLVIKLGSQMHYIGARTCALVMDLSSTYMSLFVHDHSLGPNRAIKHPIACDGAAEHVIAR